METIYKYDLNLRGETIINLPPSAQIVSTKEQEGNIKLWVITDPEQVSLPAKFHVYRTWEQLPELNACEGEQRIPIETLQIGPYAYHVFFIKKFL